MWGHREYMFVDADDVIQAAFLRELFVREQMLQMAHGDRGEHDDVRDADRGELQGLEEVRHSIESGSFYSPQLSSRQELSIGHLFDSPTYSDVTLEVDQRTFHAHRIVLCSWSDVFKSVLAAPSATDIGKLHDGASNVDKHTYRLVEEEECCKVFDQFLAFMYKESLDITQENFLPILKLSKKYDILELTLLCDKYLVDLQRDVSSAITVLHQAVEYKMEKTTRSCLGVMRTNFELIEAEELRTLSGLSILALLDVEENIVVASEFAVFEKLTPWLNDCGDEELFMKVIRDIRFPLMTGQQLKTVAASDIMKRVQQVVPTFLIDAMEDHALLRESLINKSPQHAPRPRLYLNNRATVFGKGVSKERAVDGDGFANIDGESGELRVDNVCREIAQTTGRSEHHYKRVDSDVWRVRLKSSQRSFGLMSTWGTKITIHHRGSSMNPYAMFMSSQTQQSLESGMKVEVAVQVRFDDGQSYVFASKKVLTSDECDSSEPLFSFETPFILHSRPTKYKIRATLLVHLKDHESGSSGVTSRFAVLDNDVD